jgi:valyl-tRNA synthetase
MSTLQFNHADKWILSKLSTTIKTVNEAL